MKKAVFIPALAAVMLAAGCSGQGSSVHQFSCDEVSFSINVPDFVSYKVHNLDLSQTGLAIYDKSISLAVSGEDGRPVNMTVQYNENSDGNTMVEKGKMLAELTPDTFSIEKFEIDGLDSYIFRFSGQDSVHCDYMLDDNSWVVVSYLSDDGGLAKYQDALVDSLKSFKRTDNAG